jgi:replicative DNA helicase
MVDYIQLGGVDGKYDRRDQEIGEITGGLKSIAKEFDVPVLAAAQLSRALEQRSNKRPVLSDLRESGSLENDADVVMFIYRPDQYEKDAMQNKAEIIVSKHRNGPVGTVDLIFRPELTRFESATSRVFAPNGA